MPLTVVSTTALPATSVESTAVPVSITLDLVPTISDIAFKTSTVEPSTVVSTILLSNELPVTTESTDAVSSSLNVSSEPKNPTSATPETTQLLATLSSTSKSTTTATSPMVMPNTELTSTSNPLLLDITTKIPLTTQASLSGSTTVTTSTTMIESTGCSTNSKEQTEDALLITTTLPQLTTDDSKTELETSAPPKTSTLPTYQLPAVTETASSLAGSSVPIEPVITISNVTQETFPLIAAVTDITYITVDDIAEPSMITTESDINWNFGINVLRLCQLYRLPTLRIPIMSQVMRQCVTSSSHSYILVGEYFFANVEKIAGTTITLSNLGNVILDWHWLKKFQ